VSVHRIIQVVVPGLLALTLLCAPASASASEVWALDVVATALDPCPPADSPECEPPVDDTTVAGLSAPTAPNGAGWFRTSPVRVTLSGHDGSPGTVTMDYQIDNAAVQTGKPIGQVLDFGIDGQWVLKTQAVDAAGTGSGMQPRPIKIDTAPPANTTAVSAAWSNTSVPITVTGTDVGGSGVASVEWKLDGSAVQSTASLVVSGDGTHSLETRITDVAGNTSGWRLDQVKIDSSAPSDSTAVSGAWIMGNSAPVTITGTDDRSGIGTVQWVLDGVSGSSLSASYTLAVSGNGEHTLQTQVIDLAGNASGWSDHVVRIDSDPPSNLTPVIDPAWRSSDVIVRLDGADGGSGLKRMEWSLNGSAAKPEVAGTNITVSGTGGHTLRTRAVDMAGHASGWRTDLISIDKVAPTDLTATPPAGAVPSPYEVTVDGDDLHSFVDHVEWKIDGGPTQTGPDGSTVLLSGTRTFVFQTRIVDAAGNDSGWRSKTVTVDSSLPGGDTTPPIDTTSPPTGWQTGDVALLLNGADAGVGISYMQFRRGGSSVATQAPGTTIPITGDGVHRVETRAVDGNGNRSNWRSHTIRIDTTVPVDDTVLPTGWTSSGTFRLAGQDSAPGSGIENIEWEIESGASGFGPPGSDVAVADGDYVIRHRAVDLAGQVTPWVEGTLKVDAGAPVNTTPTPPAGWITSPWTATPSGTDAVSGFDHGEWRIDGGTVQTGDVTLDADGPHLLETRAVDVAGKQSVWRQDDVQVDLNAPTDTTPAVPAGWRTDPWSVTPAAADGLGAGVDTLEWKLGALGTPSSTFPIVVSDQGETTFYTRSTDLVGHISAWRPHVVKIDSVAPSVTLDCGDGAWRRSAAACATAADGGPSGIASLTFTAAGSARAVAPGAAGVVEADGEWPVTLDAVDGAGNAAQATGTVRVDRTPPTPALACAPAATPLGWDCSASATDAASGVASVRWRLDGGAWQAPAPGGGFSVQHGTVEVEATDVAGHVAVSAPSALADRTPPVAARIARLRTRTVPVALRGTRGDDGMIGAFELRTLRSDGRRPAAAADVRPLALGSGRFRVTVRLTSGQLTAKRVRTVRFGRRGGTTPRMGVALSGIKQVMHARLTVERRTGRRWKRVAAATTSMKP
jgi:hypothetical protein